MSTPLTMIIKSTSTVYTILFMHVLFNNKLVYLELFSLYNNQDEFDVTIERFFTDKYNNVMKLTFLILLTLMISWKSTQILFSTTLVYL